MIRILRPEAVDGLVQPIRIVRQFLHRPQSIPELVNADPILTAAVLQKLDHLLFRVALVGRRGVDPVAQLKRQIMGREVVVAITAGKLDFGPWEQIFYGEFDGRRRKRALVKIVGE